MASEENPRDRFIELVEEGVLDPVTAATMSAKWLSRDEMTQLLDTYEINEEGREPRDLFIQLVEDGMLDGVQATIMTAKWMGTDDVQEMLRVNELLDDHEDNGNGDSAPTASPGRPEGGSDTKATQKHVYALGEVLEMMDEEEYPEETAKLNEVHQELKRLSTSKGTGPFVTTLNESHEDAVYDEFENYFQNDLDEEETKVLNEVGAIVQSLTRGSAPTAMPSVPRSVPSDGEGKRFLFWDGLNSFTMSDKEILNLGTEDDEPELYEFARNAKMGDVMFSENFGGPDVERVPADYRYGDERFSDADRILAGEIRAWAKTHPNEKQAEKFADDLLRRGEKRAVTEILLESEGMQIEEIMNSILHDYKDKDRAWAKEQFLRAWNNTDAELLPTGDYPGAVVREILQHQFDIGSGWNSDDIVTRNLIHGNFGHQGEGQLTQEAHKQIWDTVMESAERMARHGDDGGYGKSWSKAKWQDIMVDHIAEGINDFGDYPSLKHLKDDPNNPDWGHVHSAVRHAIERYREDNPLPDADRSKEAIVAKQKEKLKDLKDDSPMAERIRVATKMDDVIYDAMEAIGDNYGGRHGRAMGEIDASTMESKLRELLAEVYTSGADTNVFPHEEIAEAIGESPQAVDGYFADDFNIDAWHREIPKGDSYLHQGFPDAQSILHDHMMNIRDVLIRLPKSDPDLFKPWDTLTKEEYRNQMMRGISEMEEAGGKLGKFLREEQQAIRDAHKGKPNEEFVAQMNLFHEELNKAVERAWYPSWKQREQWKKQGEAPEPSMYWNPIHNVWVADLASSQLIHPFTEEFGSEGAVQEISHIEHEGPPKVDGLKVLYESYPDGTHITGELRFDHDENSWVIRTTGEWADYFRQQGMSDHYNLEGGWPVHSYDMSEAKSPRDFDKNWKPEKEKGDSQGQDKNYPHHDAEFHYKGDAYIVVGFDPDKKENIVKNRGTEKTFKLKPDQITTLITAESKIDLQAFGEEKPRRSRPPVLRTGKKGGKLKSFGLKKIKAPRVGKVKSYMDSITGRKFTRRAKGGMPKSKRFTRA